jgi:glycine betaine transporter
MLRNPVMLIALAITAAVAIWGLVDTQGLAAIAKASTSTMFESRGWFIMLSATVELLVCLWLATSRFGSIKLGRDDEEPEFSTVSWLTMLFAAGMGVGLLFFGAAEPISHFLTIKEYVNAYQAPRAALLFTDFHWGLHAWGIYGITALVIAYFGFRRGCTQLVSAPIRYMFGETGWPRMIGAACDLMAIVAIAIGLAGSVAMGVYQVQSGVNALFGWQSSGIGTTATIFVALCLAFLLPLTVDLGQGMARLSNLAMGIAVLLLLFIILAGPTHLIMSGIVDSFGVYLSNIVEQSFRTFTFADEKVNGWFEAWTLTYMVWWLAWAPFVGVFIARISRGRTIREFVIGVLLVPTTFSIIWFGAFGTFGFVEAFGAGAGDEIVDVVSNDINRTTFFLLDLLPFSTLSTAATAVAIFLFVVTSVVSAAYVLAMFSSGGNPDPSTRLKLTWGVILSVLGLVMILANDLDAIRAIIAFGALPFVLIVAALMMCLLKALRQERTTMEADGR